MLYPIESAEDWARKYDLPIKTGNCSSCGVMLIADIPFATKKWRGLRSAPHACGENFALSCAINVDENSPINKIGMTSKT